MKPSVSRTNALSRRSMLRTSALGLASLAFHFLSAGESGLKAALGLVSTDPFASRPSHYRAVEGRVSVPDLHATILHQLGLDHNRLTYLHHGNEETLTDSRVTQARVVHELLA